MGNFLWGKGGKQLGFGLKLLKFGTHLNNAANAKTDNPSIKNMPLSDSKEVQRAIEDGYEHEDIN